MQLRCQRIRTNIRTLRVPIHVDPLVVTRGYVLHKQLVWFCSVCAAQASPLALARLSRRNKPRQHSSKLANHTRHLQFYIEWITKYVRTANSGSMIPKYSLQIQNSILNKNMLFTKSPRTRPCDTGLLMHWDFRAASYYLLCYLIMCMYIYIYIYIYLFIYLYILYIFVYLLFRPIVFSRVRNIGHYWERRLYPFFQISPIQIHLRNWSSSFVGQPFFKTPACIWA